MHSYEDITNQISRLGIKPGRLFIGEIRVLPHILMDDEVIERLMTGRYDAGPAILVATNKRLILADKKPLNLTIEDIPYDMISEVEYCVQAFNAHISIHSISKRINVMSFRQTMLSQFAGFVQNRVMQIRSNNRASMNPLLQMSQGQSYTNEQLYAAAQQPQIYPAQNYYSKPYQPTSGN